MSGGVNWLRRSDENEAGRTLLVAVAVVASRRHHPAAAAAGQRHRLPAGRLAGDAVAATPRAQIAPHRRRLALDADRCPFHQVVAERRLGRRSGDVAARTDTGQFERRAVPATTDNFSCQKRPPTSYSKFEKKSKKNPFFIFFLIFIFSWTISKIQDSGAHFYTSVSKAALCF